MRTLLVPFLGAVLLAPRPVSADAVDRYVSMALQGDVSGASTLFATLPDSATARERELAASFRRRFGDGSEQLPVPEDAFASDIVRTYRTYWRRVLLRESSVDEAETFLMDRLRKDLERHGLGVPEDGDVLARMGQGIEAAGLHHISGKTLPHFELMLWARQDTTRYDVVLPQGTRPVDVVFVGDFLVKGWADFATFGRASTGGWATEDALFCLRDDYDLESERFRVSYLKHETQHFADYETFPELEQIDLEYRAKLTELAYLEDELVSTIRHFVRSASPNPAAPHAFANDAVTRDLSKQVFSEELVTDPDRWAAADRGVIHEEARRLLDRSTAALSAAGADITTGLVKLR